MTEIAGSGSRIRIRIHPQNITDPQHWSHEIIQAFFGIFKERFLSEMWEKEPIFVYFFLIFRYLPQLLVPILVCFYIEAKMHYMIA